MTQDDRKFFGPFCQPAKLNQDGTWVGPELNVGSVGKDDIGQKFPVIAILVDEAASDKIRQACQSAPTEKGVVNFDVQGLSLKKAVIKVVRG
ncbi:hypothetical protein [Actinoplanes nipponensis]|nr:hypothetical protein [Actinoplanes nipponensis]